VVWRIGWARAALGYSSRGNVQRLLIARVQDWGWRAIAAFDTCPSAVMPVIYINDMGNGTGDGRAVEKAMSLGVRLGFQAFHFQRYPISVFSIWSWRYPLCMFGCVKVFSVQLTLPETLNDLPSKASIYVSARCIMLISQEAILCPDGNLGGHAHP